MMDKVLSLLILVVIFSSPFANHHSTARGEPVRILFDTDMGSDCDDAGALAILHVYADRGLAEILGCIYSSGQVPYGAGVVQAINIYYGRPEVPVGAVHDDKVGDPVDKMTAEKLAKDTAAFGNTIIHRRDAEEMTALNRRLLAREHDNSVVYLTVGHTKGFHDLLVSKPDDISPLSGHELVKKKVKRWVAMGALGANNKEGQYRKEWNFHFNGSAPYTKYLVENCPVPIVYIAAGSDVFTGKSLKTTESGNIVRTVYRDWLWNVEKKTLDDQRPSWDLIAVHYAVNGLGEYLVAEEDGWLEFDVDKGARWIQGQHKNPQTFVSLKSGMSKELADYLNALLAAKRGGDGEGARSGLLFALAAETGNVRWEAPFEYAPVPKHDVPAVNLRPWMRPVVPVVAYNAKHRLVIVTVNGNEFHVRQASDGSHVWSKTGQARGDIQRIYPPVVTDDHLLVSQYNRFFGFLLDMRTGEPVGADTGIPSPRSCARIIGNNDLLVYRNAATEVYDIPANRRIGLNSVRSGCTTSFIPAGGVMAAPMLGHGCVCNYPMFASLALYHMPTIENLRPAAVKASWKHDGRPTE